MEQQLEIDWGDDFNLGEQDAIPSSEVAPAFSDVDLPAVSDAATPPAACEEDPSVPVGFSPERAVTYSSQSVNPTPRTAQLEQALEQCQRYIDDLKSQLTDQGFLAEQLATTEEFSHIQKQAILTLQGQLTDQKQLVCDVETLRQKQAALAAELAEKIACLEAQTVEMERLEGQLVEEQATSHRFKDQTERLSTQMQLSQDAAIQETQQRILAQTTAERLRNQLRDRDTTIQTLETKLQQSEGSLCDRQDIIDALQQTNQSDSHKNQAIQGLSTNLLKAQARVADLEVQLSSQSIVQAQYQHSTQEFEAKAQGLQSRAQELEQQVAEMQEQILQQAQQAREYETAVQHWKDRCLVAEQGMAQLKQVLERLLCDRNLSDGLLTHQLEVAIADVTQSLPAVASLGEATDPRRGKKLDLPALVQRWRQPRG